MADEATVVGIARGTYWLAGCARCGWEYRDRNRAVIMAAQAHCQGCGGDVTVRRPSKDVPGAMVVELELERDVRGRVVNAPEAAPRTHAEQTLDSDALDEYRKRDYYR